MVALLSPKYFSLVAATIYDLMWCKIQGQQYLDQLIRSFTFIGLQFSGVFSSQST